MKSNLNMDSNTYPNNSKRRRRFQIFGDLIRKEKESKARGIKSVGEGDQILVSHLIFLGKEDYKKNWGRVWEFFIMDDGFFY